jgi:hypothetical protein
VVSPLAPPLLPTASMPEPEENEDKEEQFERRVVYETVSSSSMKANTITFIVIIVIAIALIAWVVMQMR